MGLISLAGAVESAADVQIADINKAINSQLLPMSKDFYATTAEWILAMRPDLVGFMTEADSYHHLLRIIESIKARRPQVLTLLGGPQASAVHYQTLHSFPGVDFIIRGEGENALRSLAETLANGADLAEVGNLTWRKNGRIVVNHELPLIQDLDTLPFPDFSRISLEPQDQIFVEIGRGCPFKCNFCFTAPYWHRKHRIKSAPRIIQELTYFKREYGRTDFNFTHDLFTTNRRWVIDFCRQLADTDLNVTWTCSSRTDTIDEEQIYWLRRAGCRNIYFGVEAGTAEMQVKIDKNLDLAEARYMIGKTVEAGIGVTTGFIAGLPGESDTSFHGTLKEAFHYLRLPGATVHLFGYSPYQGSAIFNKIESGLTFDPHFVDFPLSEEVHRENCQLMNAHLDIFSRYSWPNSYDRLEVGTVRAAEEYFPMVNALRPLMLALDERGVDPLDLLSCWAVWVRAINEEQQRGQEGLYQGTIQDFLVFLRSYLESHNHLDPVMEEMLRWESLKNALRSKSNELPIPAMFKVGTNQQGLKAVQRPQSQGEGVAVAGQEDGGARARLHANPSIVTGHFEHPGEFLPDLESPEPGVFAFYMRRDGTSAIVRLQPIAAMLLDLAKGGISYSELLEAINVAPQPDYAAPPDDSVLSAVFAQLQDAELLLPQVTPEVAYSR
jgi:radical SAM superfamily enzyme YgiQ (UPF0313 family)